MIEDEGESDDVAVGNREQKVDKNVISIVVKDGGEGFILAVTEHQERHEYYPCNSKHVQRPPFWSWLHGGGREYELIGLEEYHDCIMNAST